MLLNIGKSYLNNKNSSTNCFIITYSVFWGSALNKDRFRVFCVRVQLALGHLFCIYFYIIGDYYSSLGNLLCQ